MNTKTRWSGDYAQIKMRQEYHKNEALRMLYLAEQGVNPETKATLSEEKIQELRQRSQRHSDYAKEHEKALLDMCP